MNKPYKLIKTLCSAFLGKKQKRYEARYTLLQLLAIKLGFRLYGRHLAWLYDADYKKVWSKFPETNNFIHERRFNLFYLARSLRNVQGDIAECGVYRGAGSFLMLATQEETDKKLFVFDSFEGLSEPKREDCVETDFIFKWKKHDLSVSESIARQNLSRFGDRVEFLKGWIPDRFLEVADNHFSMVHIDVDLYEPTRDAVRFFYPRLTRGGMIICDDYGFLSCPGAKRAMDEAALEFNTVVVHLTTGQGLILKV